jgi:Phosphotransferase enzyme family
VHLLTPDYPPTTPSELSSALYAAGSLQQGEVVGATITKRFQTTVSNLWFLELEYDGSSSELPHRLVVKWPLKHSPAPDQGIPEGTFYRELAPMISSPPIVRCLATASPTSKPQWLILEDLRQSHSNPPWPECPGDDQVYEAVAVLARFHAAWWNSPKLGSTVGTFHTEKSLRSMVNDIAANLPGLIDDLKEDLPVSDRSILEAVFSSSLQPWFRLLKRRALTVVHGDAHPWNFLFPRSGKGAPYLIDWQLWHLDVAPRDVAFLLALHWEPTVRRQLEIPLLQHYHEELVKCGINDYSFDELLLDYRRCVLRNLTFPIILWSRGLAREAWRNRLNYALAAYRDLDCAELL